MRRHQVRPSGAGRHDRGDGERGETLVELLATITIMGVGIIGVLLSLTNAILISDRVSAGSRANVAAQEQAELIKQAAYVPCAEASTYDLITDDPGHDLPSGWTVEIVDVRYWDGDELADEVGWSNDRPNCLSNGDNEAQQMVVRVRSALPRQVTKEVVVVKRDRTCPSTAPSEVTSC